MDTPATSTAARLQINDTPLGLEIVVSVQRVWPLLLFLSFWLCGWAAGEAAAVKALFHSKTPIPARLFLLVWLTGWTAGGGFALALWLWMLGGRERITADALRIKVAYELFGKGWVREYEMAKIKNLRLAAEDPTGTPPAGVRSKLGKTGRLAFDVDGKTVRFCSAGNAEEAARALAALKTRYASLGGPKKYSSGFQKPLSGPAPD